MESEESEAEALEAKVGHTVPLHYQDTIDLTISLIIAIKPHWTCF